MKAGSVQSRASVQSNKFCCHFLILLGTMMLVAAQRQARRLLASASTALSADLSSVCDESTIFRLNNSARTFASDADTTQQPSHQPPPFETVVIANRGEIACRVIRTCRLLGIRTVAVYSEADGPDSYHASMADCAVKIGVGPSPAESYLRGDEILDVALNSGADPSRIALHPGYGFLSENSSFATAVSESGVKFIGPPASAILAMGSKSHSKAIMEAAGVPCTPGYHEHDQDVERLLHEAVNNVGFPLLIKATMGGGGKGMRIVWSEEEFLPALESAKSESLSAFGDTNVILERYLVDPRHIEVQVMVDTHGNGVSLYERDCSLQRRHQKIIEEAPASDLPDAIRKDLGEKAVMAAKAVDYENAGTVEFLLDTQSKDGDFFFCEMNTRLQVEHPITEMITKQDLVEWQLRIAAGQELPIKNQKDIPCIGHAFEARIYAENPAKNFMPQTGHVWYHNPPAPPNAGGTNVDVRVDTAIKTEQDITVHYDPMISKLVVHSEDRPSALQKLISSLKQYQLAGVPSNIPFLVKCAEHPTFATLGAVNTGFLEHHAQDVKIDAHDETGSGRDRNLLESVAASALLLLLENRKGVKGTLFGGVEAGMKKSGSPWSNLSGSWRMGGENGRFCRTLTLLDEEEERTFTCLSNRDGSFDIIYQDMSISIDGFMDDDGKMSMVVNGTQHMSFQIVSKEDKSDGIISVVGWATPDGGDDGTNYTFSTTFRHPYPSSSLSAGGEAAASGAAVGSRVKAPMPGKIVRLNVEKGDEVGVNDVLIVLEAMKMEHIITAPSAGQIVELKCSVGDIVDDGSILAVIQDMDVAPDNVGDAA